MQWCTVGLPAVKIKMQIGELFFLRTLMMTALAKRTCESSNCTREALHQTTFKMLSEAGKFCLGVEKSQKFSNTRVRRCRKSIALSLENESPKCLSLRTTLSAL